MGKMITRRDLLRIAGGSALGVLFTPLPWKLIDDSAIWTQNWALTPRLPRGRVTVRYTSCTLCPGGCPVRARCVGGMPVSLAGAPFRPSAAGALCPLGLAGHHLPFHSRRLVHPLMRVEGRTPVAWRPCAPEDVLGRIAAARGSLKGRGRVGIYDRRPGRSVSSFYIEWARRNGNAVYCTPGSPEEETAATLRRLAADRTGPLAFDFGRARTVLSFGAPLLGGWGNPSVMESVFGTGATTELIQADSYSTATSRRASRWIPLRPGAEFPFAAGVASAMLSGDHPVTPMTLSGPHSGDLIASVRAGSPEEWAARASADPAIVRSVARSLAGNGPSLVIAGRDPAGGPLPRGDRDLIALLQILVMDSPGGGAIVPRGAFPDEPDAPEATIDEVADGSLDLLLLDDADDGLALPGEMLRKKLTPGGMIVAFSHALAGPALIADAVLPAPAPYESIGEVVPCASSDRLSLALSAPLFPPRVPSDPLASFLLRLQGDGSPVPGGLSERTATLQNRLRFILERGSGSVFDPATGDERQAGSFDGVDALREALMAGGRWIDGGWRTGQPMRFRSPAVVPAKQAVTSELALRATGTRGLCGSGAVPAIMSKLFTESGLKASSGTVLVNPDTARGIPAGEGDVVEITTSNGSSRVRVHPDPSVPPGVILCAVSPGGKDVTDDPLALCVMGEDGCWAMTPLTITG